MTTYWFILTGEVLLDRFVKILMSVFLLLLRSVQKLEQRLALVPLY